MVQFEWKYPKLTSEEEEQSKQLIKQRGDLFDKIKEMEETLTNKYCEGCQHYDKDVGYECISTDRECPCLIKQLSDVDCL